MVDAEPPPSAWRYPPLSSCRPPWRSRRSPVPLDVRHACTVRLGAVSLSQRLRNRMGRVDFRMCRNSGSSISVTAARHYF